MNKRKRIGPAAAIVAAMLLTAGCQQTPDPASASRELMELEREFSSHSEKVGSNKAFLDYIDEEAVLLRSNRYPVEGRDKITELFNRPDTGFVLTWEPSFAFVSSSGDLGYTYGIYQSESISPEGTPVVNKGTYVTIWRKNKEGKWKFVLDTGNPGLERKKPDLE